MKILFICTAFNSLSQRLALVLRERGHSVTVEYALTPSLMIEAAELSRPDLIICPFLTKRVPPAVYNSYLTLIVHPGPPGDAGPSALDWFLLGDLGEHESADQQLSLIDAKHAAKNAQPTLRSHWGITVLQAIEAFDAGPVWAFDQFEVSTDVAAMTKSDLYRGPVTRAAVGAVIAAVDRITAAAGRDTAISPSLDAPPTFRTQCVSRQVPFLGGRTHDRPLLKASSRDFFPFLQTSPTQTLSADTIVQRIRSADSQPGILSTLFGTPLFIYNAHVQRDPLPPAMAERSAVGGPGTVLATREGAVLVNVGADYPLWIAHLRRPKAKTDKYLHPKLPSTMALKSLPELATRLGLFSGEVTEWSATEGFGADAACPWQHRPGTYQQVWVDITASPKTGAQIAYVHSEFYNGAFSTSQCETLLAAMQWTLAQPGLKAMVMLGGSGYFSNGIALNVIEGSDDPSAEGWANINAIDDCVQAMLAPKGIVTFAALRGNAAAGGLAMATAADYVISTETSVLNPHYRGLGLFGSEWHTYSWYERCGASVARKFAREMLPMSSTEAKSIGLVDHVVANTAMDSTALLGEIRVLVDQVMDAKLAHHAESASTSILRSGAPWTRSLHRGSSDSSQSLAEAVLDNKARYLAHLFADQSADSAALSVEQNFLRYRHNELAQMTLDFFHPFRNQRFASRCTGFVRKLVPDATPFRFALHRRVARAGLEWSETQMAETTTGLVLDEEEMDEFDGLDGEPVSAAVARLPGSRPEYILIQRPAPGVAAAMDRSQSSGQDTLSTTTGEAPPQPDVESMSPISTAPTSPRGSVKGHMLSSANSGLPLSLGDEEAQRVEIEAEQLQVSQQPSLSNPVPRGLGRKGPSAITFQIKRDDVQPRASSLHHNSHSHSHTNSNSNSNSNSHTNSNTNKVESALRSSDVTSTGVSRTPKQTVAPKAPTTSSSKFTRFFQSLGRKSSSSVHGRKEPSPVAVPVPVAVGVGVRNATTIVPIERVVKHQASSIGLDRERDAGLAGSFAATLPGSTGAYRDRLGGSNVNANAVEESQAAVRRNSRRSSVSDVFGLLSSPSRSRVSSTAAQDAQPASPTTPKKSERRRSWRPSSSSSSSSSPATPQHLTIATSPSTPGSQFVLNPLATPKIPEEAFATGMLDSHAPPSDNAQNCLFSCYYAEDGSASSRANPLAV
ncbi:hypothetical protein BCV70DRAFT_199974 [Testicularia cyperi]|uniref:Formyl transferase C-terminal domain-containing protein n=1 Tax=Testicularia cyperi TaxID=1882483 RepID=A0A317XQW7_9BASI|nr:hypothetical protein BCV70DRAFT_199974 [Testicularia cyperi]